jgi:hypothetical protein
LNLVVVAATRPVGDGTGTNKKGALLARLFSTISILT